MSRASRPVAVAVVVAVLVLIAAIGTTVVMRQLREAAAAHSTTSQPSPTVPTGPVQLCGQAPCVKLTSIALPQYGETVDLLADGKGHDARLRITSDRGAVLFSSQITTVDAHAITCQEGRPSVCLLQGKDSGGLIGEVFTDDNGTWRQTQPPFSSDAGYLALRDVNGDSVPDVVTTQSRCGDTATATCTKVGITVFQATGEEIGCSATYNSPQQLPGWPTVRPDPSRLIECQS